MVENGYDGTGRGGRMLRPFHNKRLFYGILNEPSIIQKDPNNVGYKKKRREIDLVLCESLALQCSTTSGLISCLDDECAKHVNTGISNVNTGISNGVKYVNTGISNGVKYVNTGISNGVKYMGNTGVDMI